MQQDNTVNLPKAIHYVHFAKMYFEDIAREKNISYYSRDYLKLQIVKLNTIIRDGYARMSADGAMELRRQIQSRDIAAIDSIINMVIEMDEETRMKVEGYCEGLRQVEPQNT